jgi:hypothetical protein
VIGLRPSRADARSATVAPARLRRAYAIPRPPWLARSTAPRRTASAGSAPSLRSVTLPAWPRTTFRCVAGEPMLSASSPLTRLAQSRAMRRLRRCHTCCETLLADPSPSSKSAACAPAAPAHHPRDRASQYNTSSPLHKAMNRATKGVTVHASPSGRVMLSATLISDDNAHHQIRHRARHGLRGGVRLSSDLNARHAEAWLRSCCALFGCSPPRKHSGRRRIAEPQRRKRRPTCFFNSPCAP